MPSETMKTKETTKAKEKTKGGKTKSIKSQGSLQKLQGLVCRKKLNSLFHIS